MSEAFVYCQKIFTIVSQDISTIGYTVKDIEELEKRNVKYKHKNTFIINRAEPVKRLKMKEVLEWMDVESVITVPNYKDFADILVQGKPILTNEPNQTFRQAIDEIVAKM